MFPIGKGSAVRRAAGDRRNETWLLLCGCAFAPQPRRRSEGCPRRRSASATPSDEDFPYVMSVTIVGGILPTQEGFILKQKKFKKIRRTFHITRASDRRHVGVARQSCGRTMPPHAFMPLFGTRDLSIDAAKSEVTFEPCALETDASVRRGASQVSQVMPARQMSREILLMTQALCVSARYAVGSTEKR